MGPPEQKRRMRLKKSPQQICGAIVRIVHSCLDVSRDSRITVITVMPRAVDKCVVMPVVPGAGRLCGDGAVLSMS
jgi:hypothetical protein